MAASGPETMSTLRSEWLVDAACHGQLSKGNVGQLSYLLLLEDVVVVFTCWICRESFGGRQELRWHELEAHLSSCSRCGARHSGKCAQAAEDSDR